jgi:nicotinate-nucleotide adenylyltransferase
VDVAFDQADRETVAGRRVPSLGLMGGTFDPIHLAHLVTAEGVFEQFALDKIIFIPTGVPPHKRSHVVTAARHRFEMVRLATAGNPRFEVSRVEIDREGLSFTVDTLQEMKTLNPPGSRLYFITGTDAILGVETWREPERLMRMCQFIAVQRPGLDPEAARQGLDRLEERYNCRILRADVPAIDTSSSDIRRRVGELRSIRYLVPEAVETYIHEHGLYRPPGRAPE